jgi:hypothetical protein
VGKTLGSAKLGADLVELICSGVAVLVATRSDDLRPEVVRGWGPAVSAAGELLTLCVPAAPGSVARSNLEANGETAALFVSPSDYHALQVKGAAVSLSEPTPGQLQLTEEHVLAFAENTRMLGVGTSQIRRMVYTDGVASEKDLRDRVGLHPRGARDFLDALVALRMLERGPEGYANTPAGAIPGPDQAVLRRRDARVRQHQTVGVLELAH